MKGTRSTLVARRRGLWAKLGATQQCRPCRRLFTLTIHILRRRREKHCAACTLRSNEKALKLSLQRLFILTKETVAYDSVFSLRPRPFFAAFSFPGCGMGTPAL